VRDLFKIPKIGIIAGCHVTDGVMRRNASARLVRDGVVIYTGKISSLKRFKEDAREVEAGYECGIGVENYNDLKAGDILEAFEIIKKAKTLQGPGSDVGSKAKEG
jgi:translation initiation factor IF-2